MAEQLAGFCSVSVVIDSQTVSRRHWFLATLAARLVEWRSASQVQQHFGSDWNISANFWGTTMKFWVFATLNIPAPAPDVLGRIYSKDWHWILSNDFEQRVGFWVNICVVCTMIFSWFMHEIQFASMACGGKLEYLEITHTEHANSTQTLWDRTQNLLPVRHHHDFLLILQFALFLYCVRGASTMSKVWLSLLKSKKTSFWVQCTLAQLKQCVHVERGQVAADLEGGSAHEHEEQFGSTVKASISNLDLPWWVKWRRSR